jgi:hypothetical protein
MKLYELTTFVGSFYVIQHAYAGEGKRKKIGYGRNDIFW